MSILYWNISAGLLSKWDYVRDLVEKYRPDVFFISEAELRGGLDHRCLNIQDYEIVMSNTMSLRGKARIIALVKQNGPTEIVVQNNSGNEIIFLKSKNCWVVGCYRPFKTFDNETISSNFNRMLESLKQIPPDSPIIVVGDLNIDPYRDETNLKQSLIEWSDRKGLELIELGITRSRKVAGVLQTSTLDLVFTNIPNLKVENNFCDLSDHCVVNISVTTSTNKTNQTKKRVEWMNWKGFDGILANNYFGELINSTPSIFECHSVDEVDYRIRAGLVKTFDKFVPSRWITVRQGEVCSPKITRLKNRKNRLRKVWNKNKTLFNWENFVTASKQLRKEVRWVRRGQLRSKIMKGQKEFWKEVNGLMGNNQQGIDMIEKDGEIVNDAGKVCDLFMEFFIDKVEKNVDSYEQRDWNSFQLETGSFDEFSESELRRAFARLSGKKSSGMDTIPGLLLKNLQQSSFKAIRHLFNLVIKQFRIPPTWKVAKLSPVFKKGRVSNINNYRPVSNLSSLAKLFELCVLGRFENLDLDEVLGRSQHGFRKCHGTDTAVSTVVSHLSKSLSVGKRVICYSADLTAAFDLLRKEVLVEIMVKKQIPTYLIRIVFAFLSNREGFVQIGQSRSCVREIKLGCVQGSILGPFLFNVYTSELDKIISPWSLVSYADDAYISIEGEDLNELKDQFVTTFTRHEQWLQKIGMVCNKGKTEVVIFGSGEIMEIKVGTETIKTSKVMKMLGIWVDWDLKWKTHVEKAVAKCRSLGFALRYLNKYLTREEMKKIFISHFTSKLCYGSPVWANAINYNQRALLRSVYYKQVRVILRDFRYNFGRREMANKLGVHMIDDILLRRMSVFIFSILESLYPSELSGLLLSFAYHNPRQEERLFFFRESRSLVAKSHITSVAHSVVPRWTFDYLNLSKLAFKTQLDQALREGR